MIGTIRLDATTMGIEEFVISHQRIRSNRPGTGVRELIRIWYRSQKMFARLGWKVDPNSGKLVPRIIQKGAITETPVERKNKKNKKKKTD